MADILILSEDDIRSCVSLDLSCVDLVAKAFQQLSAGSVVMPSVLRMDIPEKNGEVDVKTAYMAGLDSFAIKVSPGFFDNPAKGLPSTSGLMVLHDADTGRVRALLLDNGYLTDLRTAAAGAVAAQALSRPDASCAAVLGAGTQARLQMEALLLVRDIRSINIWARDETKARLCAANIAEKTGCEVHVTTSPHEAVRHADIVVTATPSRQPLINAEMLHPGLHITAMGSDAEHKNEIAPDAVAECDLYVCDRHDQVTRIGELHHAIGAGAVPEDNPVPEIGQILNGHRTGRASAEAVTICDLTGTGVQDTAIARHAWALAVDQGLGISSAN